MALLDFMNAILVFPPAVTIILISGVVSLVTAIVYKYTTNQTILKQIKDDIKRLQGEIRATKEPGKAGELQKEMMKHSMKQMSSSTKSMFITLIPLLLLFGWMRGHLAYEPIMPGEEFTTTANFAAAGLPVGNITLSASEGMKMLSADAQEIKGGDVSWRLKADNEGSYQLTYSFGNEIYKQDVIVTEKSAYDNPVLDKSNGIRKDSALQKITVNLLSIRPLGGISLFGYMPGWLATYIITSLIFSMLVRKWLKLY